MVDTIDTHSEAIIKNGNIVISVPLKYLPQVVEGAWLLGALPARQYITDINEFSEELVSALNREDEQGTTLVHKMFDIAIYDCLESGAFGIEDHKDQQGF